MLILPSQRLASGLFAYLRQPSRSALIGDDPGAATNHAIMPRRAFRSPTGLKQNAVQRLLISNHRSVELAFPSAVVNWPTVATRAGAGGEGHTWGRSRFQ
jgi:hypothetical protein